MTTLRFNHVHASGRYDRSPKSLAVAVESYVSKSSLITLTEVSAERREQALRDVCAARNWSVVTGDKGGMDDAGIMWDNAVFKKVAGGTHILSGYTYDAKGGGACYAAWAVLSAANGKKLLVLAAHQASGVETSSGLGGTIPRVRKWRKDTLALKRLWNRLAAKHDVDAISVSCDWNVNIKRWFFRQLFKRRYPGMTRVPRKPWPARGTLGKRLIDFTFVRGAIRAGDLRVMPLNESSDHKPYIETFTI
jgi:hypothetical protein